MLCERCKKREASVLLTEIVNGVQKKHAYCIECASEMGLAPFQDMGKLLASILGLTSGEDENLESQNLEENVLEENIFKRENFEIEETENIVRSDNGMWERFTTKAQEAIQLAKETATDLGHNYVGTEHILIGLLQEGTGVAAKLLESYGVEEERVVELVQELIAPTSKVDILEPAGYTPRAKRVLNHSYQEAKRQRSTLIGTEHILIAMICESDCAATRLLNTMRVNLKKLYVDLFAVSGQSPAQIQEELRKTEKRKDSKTPLLDQYSRDLSKMAQEGKLDPVIGRTNEIARVIQILSRRTKNNPCIIGEPGVGKTAIAEGLALLIKNGEVPDTMQNKRVVALDLSGMVAGSKYRGEFEERIKKVLAEVSNAGDILLFIDELHTIMGAGGAEGAMDASNILKPSLARGEIQVIGATTTEEYRKRIEKDAALERRFQPVRIEEPTEAEAIEILQGLRPAYEEHHNVQITDEALVAAVKLSARYINDRFLPDKAVDLIDEASSKVRLSSFASPKEIKELEQKIEQLNLEKEEAIASECYEKASEIKNEQQTLRKEMELAKENWEKEKTNKLCIVGESEIADIVAGWTRIPVKTLEEGEVERLKRLESILHERVVGQNEAVVAVSKAIRRGRVGLKDPKRPIGSFLFLGPTGVGKTELCKALAEAMFGTESAMIRVDMSEYMEKHSVSKMIGSPPGYVGYEEGGQLSEKVRRNPYSVILFDEVEKAHPDVFNILLQVLDDGQITDAQGRKVDFKNTILIMTSNCGAENIITPKKLGFGSVETEKESHEFMKNRVMEALKNSFRPEFLNRIDEIIVFHMLNQEHIMEIADIMLASINKRTKEQMGMTLQVDEQTKKFLAEKGWDQKYGARPLRRAIQTHLEDMLAEEILEGNIQKGSTVTVTVEDGKLKFQ